MLFLCLMVAAVLAGACSQQADVEDGSTIAETREELLGYVIDIPNSSGYRYQATDDKRHTMDAAKIIQIAETGEFAAVYHWWADSTQTFTPSLATSDNLLNWEWRVDLAQGASQPSIAPASDGGYVVSWEHEADLQITLSYYPTWDTLLAGEPTKRFTAERQLPGCAEGTANIYSASSVEVDFGLHYYADCESDRQARGKSDWSTWTAESQPLLDRAALFQGYRGSIGDRDFIEYEGYGFTFLEAQFIQGDWRTFRVLLYDDELGAQDRAGFPDTPVVPPSVHVFLHTHHGSSSFTNFTISEVTVDGQRALVMAVFIPEESVGDEVGELIYYRLID